MAYRLSPLALWITTSAALFTTACATPPRTMPTPEPAPETPSVPTPPPEPPTPPSPELPGATEWEFSYTPTPVSYVITTTGTLTQLSHSPAPPDSLSSPPSENSLPQTVEKITVQYTPSTSGPITTVIEPALVPGPCNDTAALHSRAQSLLPRLPSNHLTAGMTWSDSLVTTGCRGPVVATVQARYDYQVAGDTVFLDQPVLLIRRSETIQAGGEGSLGQHRVVLDAKGSATSQIFLDVTTGTLAGLIRTDSTHITVQTSGRQSQFLQHSTESVHRDPPRR